MATKIDEEFTESELLDELAALALPERRPGGVTVRELIARGLSEAQARRILRKQERAGVLYSMMCLDSGHPVKTWYRK